MDTELYKDEIEIDLRELAGAIFSKLVLIIFVGIVGAGVAFAYTKIGIQPKYTSSTQVYIMPTPESEKLTTSDLAFASYLALDYQVLIVSDPVMKQVISDLNLNMTTKSLASCIKVSLLEDTRVIKIDVTTTSPQMSKNIADKVREVANGKTKDVMGGIEAIRQIDEADLPGAPSSPNVIKNTAIGFVLGAGIVVVIVVILFILDDTIKTQEDIEKYLGISVLASIPVQKDLEQKKKKSGKVKSKEA